MSLADLLKKGSLRGFANAKPANVAKYCPFIQPTLATLATIALAKAPDTEVNDPPAAPVDWHALDAAYLAHHFNCPTCIAAGRGDRYGLRCGTGATLWRAYVQADQPGGKNCDLKRNED